MHDLVELEIEAALREAAALARDDLYAFSRQMFMARKGYAWRRAKQHQIICDALMRVYRGECKRLIINVPPRYSKTELAVVNFIAWCFGHAPDAEFIHASYSGTLAVNNSTAIRGLMTHEHYGRIFPGVQLASNAQHHWTTTAGGVMYAVGAGGTITGFGAGKYRPGFGGCFPVGTRVWTEFGLMPIDRIVKERLQVNVWAFDYVGQMVLRPVIGWHQNPPNEIFRVTFDDGEMVECTPDHRFWTDNRGWVRADSLCVEDNLPTVNSGVKSLDGVSINTERRGGRLNPEAVLPARPVGAAVEGNISLLLSQDCSPVCLDSTLTDDWNAASDRFPRVATPNLIDDCKAYAVGCRKFHGGYSDGVIDCERLRIGQEGYRVDFSLTERPVALAVDDVRCSGVVPQIGEIVVSWVPVCMANFIPGRAGASESGHHKGVDGRVPDGRSFGQANPKVAARQCAEFERLPRLDVRVPTSGVGDAPVFAFDASVVADRVKPFISGNRKPVLVERIRHDDSTFCLTVKEHHNFTIESGLVVKNCIILDDLHKADEARSDVIRTGVIDWFQNTLESRKNSPDTPIILIMQRLHEDDLAGFLLGDRGPDMNGQPVPGGNGEVWEHLCLDVWQKDELGNEVPLWPEKHSADDLRRMEQANPYVFAGQYRQRPAPPTGGVIKPDMLQEVDAIPPGVVQWCRGWDLAASDGAGDWTAGVKVGQLQDGRFILAGAVHEQFATDQRDKLIKTTADNDGAGKVIQSLPQDPGQAGKSQVQSFAKLLAGHNLHFSPESGDKVTRADPLASQINAGNVLAVRGPWLHKYKTEARIFPNGKHDDLVDASSRGFNALLQQKRFGIHT